MMRQSPFRKVIGLGRPFKWKAFRHKFLESATVLFGTCERSFLGCPEVLV